MAKDSNGRQHQLRQLIAQQAARMMAEEGISDYAYAKRRAGRQLGATDVTCLPTNAEVEEEIKLYHEIYHAEEQPQHLPPHLARPLPSVPSLSSMPAC